MIAGMELFESASGEIFIVAQAPGNYELHRVRLDYVDQFKRKHQAVSSIHPRPSRVDQH